jgi:flagellar basal body-associated protein FliL
LATPKTASHEVGASMSLIVIILIILVVLAVLGYIGRGRRRL